MNSFIYVNTSLSRGINIITLTIDFTATEMIDDCWIWCLYFPLKVRVRLSSSSMFLYRGCGSNESCNSCTRDDQRDCRKCCSSSDNCNNDALEDFTHANGLAQTCYKCSYSAIPGVWKDEGCKLGSFDPKSSDVSSIECPGMCYVSNHHLGPRRIRRGGGGGGRRERLCSPSYRIRAKIGRYSGKLRQYSGKIQARPRKIPFCISDCQNKAQIARERSSTCNTPEFSGRSGALDPSRWAREWVRLHNLLPPPPLLNETPGPGGPAPGECTLASMSVYHTVHILSVLWVRYWSSFRDRLVSSRR